MYMNISRKLWLAEGIYKHEIDKNALLAVVEKYQALGLVPQGYNQPDLYIRMEKTLA